MNRNTPWRVGTAGGAIALLAIPVLVRRDHSRIRPADQPCSFPLQHRLGVPTQRIRVSDSLSGSRC
jgi:hypothetical protein